MKLVIGLIVLLIISGCVTQSIEQGTPKTGKQETKTTPTVTPSVAPLPTATPAPEPEQTQETKASVSVKEFELNKEVFSSHEDLNARIVIESNQRVTGIEVRLTGITVGSGAKIYRAVFTDLKEGENEFFFSQKTPSSTSGCGGVFPGIYEVKVEIAKGENLLAEQTKEIELVE